MKNNYEHIDLIERYLYDDMTKEELEEFNVKLRKDKEFNKLFYDMDHLFEGIRRSARQTTVEEKLAMLEKSLPAKEDASEKEDATPVIPIFSTVTRYKTAFTAVFSTIVDHKYRMASAAAFTMLIVATFILFNIVNNTSPDAIFAQYYQPFENQGSGLRGSEIEKGDINKNLLQDALSEYDNGNFSEAASIFDRITVNDENKNSVWMYGGNAYLNEGQMEKAKKMFQNIIEEDAGYIVYAKWYLSLCYVRNEEYEEAKPLLEEIRDKGKYKSNEAEEILTKLK
jgi:tetratricopeptide (TPR) repeat protein